MSAGRPNVVLLVVDALRADHVGCYAGRDLGTPNLDRIAREGTRFAAAVTQASWTRPAVTSLMTGLYPSQHGLIDRIKKVKKGTAAVSALDPATRTLAETLAEAGYSTPAFLGGNANLKPLFGVTRGFDPIDWHSSTDGTELVEAVEGWAAGDPPQPAFVYAHFMDVHHPLPLEIIPSRLDQGLDLDLVEESRRELLEHYAAAVRKVDGHMGRVVDALMGAGLLEDAWLVVTADHGEELADHGAMLAHGRTLYRELVHVPLLVRAPDRVPAGRVVEEPVQLVDVMPTLCEALEVPAPAVAGRSLFPLFAAEDGDRFNAAFSELVRRDRYVQSVYTARQHLLQSYALEPVDSVPPHELEPGQWVRLKGQLLEGRRLLPTKVGLSPVGQAKVRGGVDAVDEVEGTVSVLGVRMAIDERTVFMGLDGEPFGPGDLAREVKVSAAFREDGDGRYVATTVKLKKSGGKAKIEGPIESVRELDGGLRAIRVLGIEVLLPPGTAVKPDSARRAAERGAKSTVLTRVLAGDIFGKKLELYDLASDPGETRNVVDEQPGVAQELEGLADTWTQFLATGARRNGSAVEVDPETFEQLRRMGYVD